MDRFWLSLWILTVIYFSFRMITVLFGKEKNKLNKIDEVIKSDKYKVKGQFDEQTR